MSPIECNTMEIFLLFIINLFMNHPLHTDLWLTVALDFRDNTENMCDIDWLKKEEINRISAKFEYCGKSVSFIGDLGNNALAQHRIKGF
jgi:hypothetical protein